ncbi:MAG: GntR family transcriptional regulator [Anaerorhabdus sp.]|uniref:GntR family transcriptional regulator n=1 Tax=Anaerorhabdus sp. TaxID=1872524 RepID=UPI003A8AE92D
MENISKAELVKSYILKKIENNVYCEGQMIDSENELCNLLGVSRMTVRQALQDLVSNEVLFKEKGRGTFVSVRPKYSEFKWGVGFTEELKKRGSHPSTKDATLELVDADIDIAKELKVNIGDKVWKVTRIRCSNDLPIIYAIEYYNYAQCEDLTIDIVYASIYAHLENKGIILSFADQKIEAVNADKLVASKLDVKINTALIKMDIIAYMKNGSPFNCGTEYYRTDRYKMVQSIHSRR